MPTKKSKISLNSESEFEGKELANKNTTAVIYARVSSSGSLEYRQNTEQ